MATGRKWQGSLSDLCLLRSFNPTSWPFCISRLWIGQIDFVRIAASLNYLSAGYLTDTSRLGAVWEFSPHGFPNSTMPPGKPPSVLFTSEAMMACSDCSPESSRSLRWPLIYYRTRYRRHGGPLNVPRRAPPQPFLSGAPRLRQHKVKYHRYVAVLMAVYGQHGLIGNQKR